METLSWPPNYVARCPVLMYEAPQGSASWHGNATIGELHMRPLENDLLQFQLRDLLDGQMLFEHTVSKPEAFATLTQRFFIIKHENGSHKGFGFSNATAAQEMKQRIDKALHSLAMKHSSNSPESSMRSLELQAAVPARPTPQAVKRKKRRPSRIKGVKLLIHFFKKHDIEIGYPTNVKHVAHIGWDGHSINGPNSMVDNVRAAPNFSSGPLRNFGQPAADSTWFLDALCAAKWAVSSSACELPPGPPNQFLDPSGVKHRKKK